MSVAARALLAALSGVLIVLSLPGAPPAGALPLAFGAFGPLFLAVRGERPMRAAAMGLACGATMTAVGFRFLVPAAMKAGLSPATALLAFAAFAVLQGARVAVHTAAAAMATRAGGPPVLTFAAAYLATEACLPHVIAWSFAAALVDATWLVQSAEIWGAPPIATGLVATGAVLADLAVPPPGTRRGWRAPALAMTGWAVLGTYGAVRVHTTDREIASAPRVRVGVVQGAVAPGPHDLSALVEQIASHRALVESGAQVVLWSEGAVPGFVDANATHLLGSLVGVTPTVLGADFVENATRFNSALAFDGGALVGRHDKRALVPFSESDVTPGQRRGPLTVGGLRLAIVICYEDVLPNEVRNSGAAESDLLVNLTNDGWFDGTDEPELHLAQARLRAVEQRRVMVRATNTGVSAVIDPNGRVLARGALGRPDVLSYDVPRLAGRTGFDRAAPWLPALWAVAFLAIVVGFRHRTRAALLAHAAESGGSGDGRAGS